MKNRYFIFNDINSFSKGIILKNHPIITSPKKRDDGIVIEGRSGKLYYNNQVYDSFVKTLECSIIDSEIDVREISAWLKGEGKLILSNEKDKFYNVNIINQIDFTNIADQLHEFPLVIEFQPFAYSIKENNVSITENCSINIKNSTALIFPKIKIYATGDVTLTINNHSQIIKDINDYIELDSLLEIAYKNNENKNSAVFGDYLTIEPGNNDISFIGDVTKIIFIYRDTYL